MLVTVVHDPSCEGNTMGETVDVFVVQWKKRDVDGWVSVALMGSLDAAQHVAKQPQLNSDGDETRIVRLFGEVVA